MRDTDRSVCLSVKFQGKQPLCEVLIFEKLGERFSDVIGQMQKILFTPVEVRLSGAIKEHL